MSNKLRIQLSQSSPQSPAPDVVEPLVGVALDAEQTAALFDGMEPLPAPITQEFQVKPATLPPALVGATIAAPFNPAQVATQAAPSDTKLLVQLTSPQGEAGLVHQVMIVPPRPVRPRRRLDAKGVTISQARPESGVGWTP
ncbi:MAG: hypothetical protein R3E66_14645 [bacterium]